MEYLCVSWSGMWTMGPVLRPCTLLYCEGSAIRCCSAMRTALALRSAMLPHDGILWDPSLWLPSPRPSNTTYRGIWSPCSSAVRIAMHMRTAGPYRGTHAERVLRCCYTSHHAGGDSGHGPRSSQHLVCRDPLDLWIRGPLSIWYLETLGICGSQVLLGP